MANLKLDLINKITNVKYFDEIEFIQLAQDPTMNYRDKLDKMDYLLKNLAETNAKLALVEQYLPEAPQQGAPAPAPAPAAAPAPTQNKPQRKVHQGQSHGE